MDDVVIYLFSAVIMVIVGLVIGYRVTMGYYNKRFLMLTKQCENVQTIAPLIAELERES
ncbi:MAG: hypothetical protein NTV68_05350 [Methanomicrobiales archaeon]|nr:hypothetical protein [Methanomicrobiales archaeon]